MQWFGEQRQRLIGDREPWEGFWEAGGEGEVFSAELSDLRLSAFLFSRSRSTEAKVPMPLSALFSEPVQVSDIERP